MGKAAWIGSIVTIIGIPLLFIQYYGLIVGFLNLSSDIPITPTPTPFPALLIDIGDPQIQDNSIPVSYLNTGTENLTDLSLNYSLTCKGLSPVIPRNNQYPLEEKTLIVGEPRVDPIHLPVNERIPVLGANITDNLSYFLPPSLSLNCTKSNYALDITYDVYTNANYSECILYPQNIKGSFCETCVFDIVIGSNQEIFQRNASFLFGRRDVIPPPVTLKGTTWPTSLNCTYSQEKPSDAYILFSNISMKLFDPEVYCLFYGKEDRSFCG